MLHLNETFDCYKSKPLLCQCKHNVSNGVPHVEVECLESGLRATLLLRAFAVPPLSLFSAAPSANGIGGCFSHFSYFLVHLLPGLSLSSLDQHPALRADLVALFLIPYSQHLGSTAGRKSKG